MWHLVPTLPCQETRSRQLTRTTSTQQPGQARTEETNLLGRCVQRSRLGEHPSRGPRNTQATSATRWIKGVGTSRHEHGCPQHKPLRRREEGAVGEGGHMAQTDGWNRSSRTGRPDHRGRLAPQITRIISIAVCRSPRHPCAWWSNTTSAAAATHRKQARSKTPAQRRRGLLGIACSPPHIAVKSPCRVLTVSEGPDRPHQ